MQTAPKMPIFRAFRKVPAKMEREPEGKDRRKWGRVKLSQGVRVRPMDERYPLEIATTINVSRRGLYFATSASHYFAGMELFVVRNFQRGDPMSREELGRVVRVDKLKNGKWGIAVDFPTA